MAVKVYIDDIIRSKENQLELFQELSEMDHNNIFESFDEKNDFIIDIFYLFLYLFQRAFDWINSN